MKSQIKVSCPICRGNTIYSNTNQYRPFCSERCKAIDLGAWADETYRIGNSTTEPLPTLEKQESAEY
ncbi:MAG: DNA gyrase inhibitor YacG [Shewanella sp.]|uniref:DNA gyrase inhibitor YacG n=1 Tax=Deefgea tanakiae TaxID=2865840 RepID=A0ABX8Z3C5_9NEIS|nr:DNA gyrase inhibitor YacG [Deefgea tanakiae]QZA77066.1 DNA gyrase inhibitor YacG [Deefgea tanakiae]